jgi:hypothetical protein
MRLAAADTHTDRQWRRLIATEVPSATADPFLPTLEERLTNLARAGFDASLLVRSAAAAGPLPDDHPAAALWWRILDRLPPAGKPGPRNDRGSAGDAAHEVTGPAASRARDRLPVSARAAEILPPGHHDDGDAD